MIFNLALGLLSYAAKRRAIPSSIISPKNNHFTAESQERPLATVRVRRITCFAAADFRNRCYHDLVDPAPHQTRCAVAS